MTNRRDRQQLLDLVALRVDDALTSLYGIDYEEGSRVDRAVTALEEIVDRLYGAGVAQVPASQPRTCLYEVLP